MRKLRFNEVQGHNWDVEKSNFNPSSLSQISLISLTRNHIADYFGRRVPPFLDMIDEAQYTKTTVSSSSFCPYTFAPSTWKASSKSRLWFGVVNTVTSSQFFGQLIPPSALILHPKASPTSPLSFPSKT